jgi:transposase
MICDTFFGGQIHQCVCAQYGDDAVSCRVVYVWIEMFKIGHTGVTHAERSDRPAAATTAQNEERARELIFQNRIVMVDEIAKQLNISIGSAYSVVHDNLQFHKVCARWVPKELTDEHKCMCLEICSRHLAH